MMGDAAKKSRYVSYAEKLKDPRWQKRRLEVLEAAAWKCESCGSGDVTLHVHHGYYRKGFEPWEYEDGTLWCLCEICHETVEDARADFYFELAFVKPWLLSPVTPLDGFMDSDRKVPRRQVIDDGVSAL